MPKRNPAGIHARDPRNPADFKLAKIARRALDPYVTKTEYILHELRFKLWLKPAIMGLVAVGWLTFAYLGADFLPNKLQIGVNRDILLNLLGILASTMLTVATFSVSAMVGAFAAVSTTATPRATRLIMADRSSQKALASFVSAFIYAIVALVALSILEYGDGGRLLLFFGYVAMVVWVLVSFVRWVDMISNLGRMGDTMSRVEEACDEVFSSREITGTLGGKPAEGEAPDGLEIFAEQIGYVQNIDLAALQDLAEKWELRIRVMRRPGAFVDKRDPLMVAVGASRLDEDAIQCFRSAFQMGDERRMDGDPRFCLIVLAEIADRALSPAVNDPGTAIGIVGIQIRLLEKWSSQKNESPEVSYPSIEVDPLNPEDLLDDAFTPISRDGAAMFEVGVRLQKCFSMLGRLGHAGLRDASIRHSRLALEQAESALGTEAHRAAIRALSDAVGD